MISDVGEVTESLENELCSFFKLSVASPAAAAFYSEREKSEKFCSETLISA